MSDISLKDRFAQVKQQYGSIEDSPLPSISPEFQALVADCLANLEKCRDQIARLALFSDNEDLDDLSTASMRLLPVEVLLAHVMQKVHPSQDRRAMLKKAKALYMSFLGRCDDYGLLGSSEANAWRDIREAQQDAMDVDDDEKKKKQLQQQQQQKTSRPATGGGGGGMPNMQAIAKQRDDKIARYKKEKEIKQQIEELTQRIAKEGTDEADQDDKDSLLRQLVIAENEYHVIKAIECIKSIDTELEMLEQMARFGPRPTPQQPPQRQPMNPEVIRDTLRLDRMPLAGKAAPSALVGADGRPLRPFTITSRAQKAKDEVFKHDYTLPTMSIDEYLELEKQRGGIVSGGGKVPEKKEIDSDDDEAHDAETMRLRAWDEFTDNTPRGSGNRMGNRG